MPATFSGNVLTVCSCCPRPLLHAVLLVDFISYYSCCLFSLFLSLCDYIPLLWKLKEYHLWGGQSKFSQARNSSQKALRNFVLQGWICREQNKKAQLYSRGLWWSQLKLVLQSDSVQPVERMYKNLSEASLLLCEHNAIVLRFQITVSVLQKRLAKLRSFAAAFHKLRVRGSQQNLLWGVSATLHKACGTASFRWPPAAVDN